MYISSDLAIFDDTKKNVGLTTRRKWGVGVRRRRCNLRMRGLPDLVYGVGANIYYYWDNHYNWDYYKYYIILG